METINSTLDLSPIVNQASTITGEPLGQTFIPNAQPKWQNGSQFLEGTLLWIGDPAVCQSIAIKVTDEKQEPDGNTPLRGIMLNRDATSVFNQHFGNTLFIGDRIALLIGSQESLDKDLADGKGLKGKQYLRAFDFTYRKPVIG